LLIVIFLFGCNAAKLNCDYNLYTSWFYTSAGEIYQCEFSGEILARNDKPVLDIDGTHLEGKKESDVQSIHAKSGQKIHYFPTYLQKHFSNIILIDIWSCGLKEVFASDLEPFYNLKALSFWKNKLEYLEPDLFTFNPNLEVLVLEKNNIKHIGYGAFANLPKLTELNLNSNACISEHAKSAENITTLISTLDEKCFNQNIATTILDRSFKSLTKKREKC
jgi:hypothetical protein